MLRTMTLTLLLAIVLVPSWARADAPRTESVKIGTLAPAESPWGQVFKTWQRAIRERTKLPNGQKTSDGKEYALDLNFFWNGQQGDEAAMVTRMKSGQLDGAAITAVGLSQIHPPILVLQLPGLYTTWEKLDKAREALRGDFERALDAAGFVLPGWGDVGLSRPMSRGFSVASPGDMRGKKPYVWREDLIMPAMMQVIGGVTPVPLGVPEVLPNLNTGAVDVIIAAALAAEQLQWASRLDTINTQVVNATIGAIVFGKSKLDVLPPDLRAIMLDTGKVAAAALTTRIRNEDAAAFGRLRSKMTVSTSSDAQLAEWAAIFKQTRARLAQGTFPKDLVEKAESLAQ
jgi:TRAP-type C4-dicarboxylate transport system substrate-binding protein